MDDPKNKMEVRMKKVKVVVLLVLVSVLTGCNIFQPSLTKEEVAEISANAVKTAIADLPTLKKVEETLVPPAPTATPVPVPPKEEEFDQEGGSCKIIHDSLVDVEMDHISSSGNFIHLEYWYPGEPERETILPAATAGGGRFNFSRGLRGWVWEYADCTFDEVKQQVDAHIQRRLEGGANNDGYYEWKETGLFNPVPLPGS